MVFVCNPNIKEVDAEGPVVTLILKVYNHPEMHETLSQKEKKEKCLSPFDHL